jgi:hypothetical protein
MGRMAAILAEWDLRIADLQAERDKLLALVERALERNQREQAERPRRRWRWRWWRRGEG